MIRLESSGSDCSMGMSFRGKGVNPSYTLKAQRYLVSGLDNQRNPYRFSEQADPREFSPNALGLYIR